MIRMDGSDRMLRMKVNQRAGHLGNANQSSESHLPQTDLSDQHTRGHTETVKHTVYQRCRSTSATSKRFASQNALVCYFSCFNSLSLCMFCQLLPEMRLNLLVGIICLIIDLLAF